jgi:hypothetical protein
MPSARLLEPSWRGAVWRPPPSSLEDIVTAAMLAWTMGSLLAVGLVVVGVLVAYAIYYLVFRLGK